MAKILGRGEASERNRRQKLIANLRRVLPHKGTQQRSLPSDRVDGVNPNIIGGEFNRRYGNRLMRYRVIMQAVALLLFAIAIAGS